MTEGIIFDEGHFGVKALVTTALTDELQQQLQDRGISDLELNQAKGWRANDVAFLVGLPGLRRFALLDLRIKDVSPISSLRALESLEVTAYFTSGLDLSSLTRLQECILEWQSGITGLFRLTSLRTLSLNRYTGRDLSEFRKLRNLQSLTLLNSPIENIRDLSSLSHLRRLRLGNLGQLKTLEGLQGTSCLEELEIHTCKSVRSIDEVAHLSHLKKLLLNNNGNIDSLRPVENLCELEWVTFYESTNIKDGDLTPLTKLRKLNRVSFMNRKHYSHRREEFESKARD